jgi:hypothetical protein
MDIKVKEGRFEKKLIIDELLSEISQESNEIIATVSDKTSFIDDLITESLELTAEQKENNRFNALSTSEKVEYLHKYCSYKITDEVERIYFDDWFNLDTPKMNLENLYLNLKLYK